MSSPQHSAERPSRGLVLLTITFLVLIWGTTWAAVRISLDGFPPFSGVALRFALGAAILFLVARRMQVPTLARPGQLVGMWAIQGSCSFGIPYVLIYWAEQWLPSGLVSVLFSTHPVFVAIFAFLLIPKERLTLWGLGGLTVGFLGILVIFSDDLGDLAGGRARFVALVMLISPACAALSQVVIKRWGHDIHPLTLNTVPMAASAVVMGIIATVLEGGGSTGGTAPILAVIYLAIFGSAIAFTLFFWVLQHVSVTQLSLMAFAIPVVAVAIGTVFLDEPLTLRLALGTLLVVVGAAVVMGRRQSEH